MKFAAITAAALLTATSISAAEIGSTGITIGAEADTKYDLDAEDLSLTLTPEVGYTLMGLNFTADMDIDVYSNEEFQLQDAFDAPMIGLEVEYELLPSLELYGKTTWDVDAGDTSSSSIGATFSF